jgi:NAD-dependent deacetylase
MASLDALLADLSPEGPLVVLTGAGISAESGIPTFRGPEGYWRAGSRHYRPMELATRAAFERVPEDVWGWYLFRRAVCRAAQPNRAHLALAELERRVDGRLLLVTQNVDGLHLRAGSRPDRTFQIHGNIHLMRCGKACSRALSPVPEALDAEWGEGRVPTPAELAALACPRCGALGRPHVLWFDEHYDEAWFRFDSSLAAVSEAALLVVVGTSGSTNLPTQMCLVAAERGIPFVVIDPEPTPFSRLAEKSPRGLHLAGSATEWLPEVAARL